MPTAIDTSGADIVNCPVVATAWVNFTGTGTVAIKDSFNVTSITDNAVGDYDVTFTTALADANYAFAINASLSGTTAGGCYESSTLSYATTGFTNIVTQRTDTLVDTDSADVLVIVFGGE